MRRYSVFGVPTAKRRSHGPILVGILLVAIVFLGFGGWAALAPLARGAVATGVVIAEGEHKTVQHLEGGIVADILVADGDAVQAGQVLVRLDGVQVGALLASLQWRYDVLLAQITRLQAERDGLSAVVFPADLLSRQGDPRVIQAINAERHLFETRKDSVETELALLIQQEKQEEDRTRGLNAQLTAVRTQIRITREDLVDQKALYEEKLIRRQRVRDLERQFSEMSGREGSLMSDIAQSQISITEKKLGAIRILDSFRQDLLRGLQSAQGDAGRLEEEITGKRDVMSRLDIRAPQDGVIQDLKLHNRGGVISPGQALMDIVPSAGVLMIEAHVNPTDIEHVAIGTEAEIRFTGLPQRTTPTIFGSVVALSPDILSDERNGAKYYLAKIRVQDKERARIANATIHPGMPSDVILKSGERTALEYMFEPLRGSINRAFKE